MAYTANSEMKAVCAEPVNRPENMATVARDIGCKVEEAISALSAIESIMIGKTIDRQKEGPSCLYGDLALTKERLEVLLNELYYLSEIIGACQDSCRSSM